MKKFCLIVCLFFANLFGEDMSIGFGMYAQSQPYKNLEPIYAPSPAIFYDNGIVYARWTRFGLYFFGDKTDNLSWGFSLTAQPRPNQYDPSKSSDLAGLEEKKSSFEGGLAFTMYGGGKYLEAMVVTDMLNRYDSYIAKVESGFKYKKGKLSLYPSVVVVYESKKFTQYYYGITQEEASRTQYERYLPDGGLRFALQSYFNYALSDAWSLFFNARLDRITNNAYNSPIVDERYIYSGLASFLYTFDF